MKTFHSRLISILSYSVILSVGLFCAIACKDRKCTESAPDEIAEHIEAYSAGVIKTEDSIRILFNESVEFSDSAAAPSRILKFTPSLKGQEIWNGTTRELEFIPEKGQLKAGKNYYCRVRQDNTSVNFYRKFKIKQSSRIRSAQTLKEFIEILSITVA